MRGYTIKICMGCSRDTIVDCFHARTPLCEECLEAHDDESIPTGLEASRLDLPPAPPIPQRPQARYVHPIRPLGRARRRSNARTCESREVAA